MGAFGCKMGVTGCKKGSVGATPSFRFAICCFAHVCPVSGFRTWRGGFLDRVAKARTCGKQGLVWAFQNFFRKNVAMRSSIYDKVIQLLFFPESNRIVDPTLCNRTRTQPKAVAQAFIGMEFRRDAD